VLIVEAVNRTGITTGVAEYDVVVRVNQTVIASGRSVRHVRSRGWRALLRAIAVSRRVRQHS
jgi:hypothetical protein